MSWKQLRQKMRDYRRAMVAEYGAWEHAWTVERGKRNGMKHVNVLQKGPYVPQRVLQRSWGGIVHVQRIGREPGHVAGYALKEARRVAGYSLKEAGAGLDEHLALNGGRLAHWSRNYFGGETLPEVRQRLMGNPSSAESEDWARVNGELRTSGSADRRRC